MPVHMLPTCFAEPLKLRLRSNLHLFLFFYVMVDLQRQRELAQYDQYRNVEASQVSIREASGSGCSVRQPYAVGALCFVLANVPGGRVSCSKCLTSSTLGRNALVALFA